MTCQWHILIVHKYYRSSTIDHLVEIWPEVKKIISLFRCHNYVSEWQRVISLGMTGTYPLEKRGAVYTTKTQ